jgi:signal peptidase I
VSATPPQVRESAVRRAAYRLLVAVVRGRRERGGEWGEAVLGEFGETRGDWEAVRWAVGGLRTVWLSRPIGITYRVIGIVVISVVAGLLINQFVLTVGYVASGSMEPTQMVGDRYLMDKVSYRLTGIHRGNLVVITEPVGGGDPVPANPRVKRVIGLPGDTIECRDGQVWRNGKQVDEPYLEGGVDDSETDCTTVKVPSGELYLLGDHRLVSQDSRQDGPISESAVRGRVLARIWPFQR